jgi:demethylmenaquinone methyltransferase/2-methoxy-6-polyprenyl-1,4-benzoquinol methylase
MSVVSKYNRIAKNYDQIESPIELIYRKWRKEAIANLSGRVLEIGVGTGRNLEYYPANCSVTGIDISQGMLDKAQEKIRNKKNITLRLMDAENLKFPDESFDYVVSTFVLGSIPDPVKALREMRRVLKPSGELIALEHMRSKNPFIAWFESIASIVTFLILGDIMTRNTAGNIKKAGFSLIEEKDLGFKDIFKKFRAKL